MAFSDSCRYRLYYTRAALRWELALVVGLPLMDLCRLRLATRGNRTERCAPLCWSVGLAAPTALGHAFLLELQTYVLHIDRWLNAAALVFLSAEVVLSVFAVLAFRGAYPV